MTKLRKVLSVAGLTAACLLVFAGSAFAQSATDTSTIMDAVSPHFTTLRNVALACVGLVFGIKIIRVAVGLAAGWLNRGK